MLIRFITKTSITAIALTFSINAWAANSIAISQINKYDERCFADVPPYVANTQNTKPRDTPVSITADRVQAEVNQDIKYSGNVEFVHGNKVLKAKNTTFNQQTQIMSAHGDVYYQDGELTVNTKKGITTNLQTNSTELKEADYHINGTLIHGSTKVATLNNEKQTLQLKNATVTTCPQNEETWQISSSEINIDQNEVFGESYHTVFWLHDVPIMYLPYINFPIKSERKSGILYPNFAIGGSDGTSFSLPIYWNIAPNYDMTFTPTIIERRGLLLANEFRYMPFENTYGTLYGEYIHHDRKKEDEEGMPKFYERYLFNVNHKTTWLNGDLGLNIDYTKIRDGDYNYINHFAPPKVSTIDSQLTQSASFYYDKQNIEAELKVLSYQLLLPEIYLSNLPFKLLPRLKVNYHDAVKDLLSYNMLFEFSNFKADSNSENSFEAQRYHFEPTINLPIIDLEGIDLSAKGALLYTYYNQHVPNTLDYKYTSKGFSTNILDKNIDRLLYRTELNGKMTFIKHLEDKTLTLEPQFQYLYIPYKNQDNIGLYDTTDRVYDFYSLFSHLTYMGYDRIGDTNRISYGITHRLYDTNYREMLRFNIGQAYDFVARRVKLNPNDTMSYYPRTPISATLDLNPIDQISAHGDIIYNTQKNETSSWNTMLNFNHEGSMAQVSYRYNRDGNRTINNEIIDLKQLGILMQLPVTPDIAVIIGGYRDLEQGLDIDKKLAIKYESCCYSIGFQIENYNKPDNYTMTAESETKLGIFFELKGLANVGINSEFSPSTKLLPHTNTVNLNK